MLAFTVTKPVGTKDKGFKAYTRLLEHVGIDVAHSPRVPEPGTERRWLYAWRKRIEADRFAAELRRRTGDPSWFVQELQAEDEERGPVAPLEIASVPEGDGFTFFLMPASRERVAAAFPGTRLSLGVTVEAGQQPRWDALARQLTGREDSEIDALGGVRIVTGEDEVAFERIPSPVAA